VAVAHVIVLDQALLDLAQLQLVVEQGLAVVAVIQETVLILHLLVVLVLIHMEVVGALEQPLTVETILVAGAELVVLVLLILVPIFVVAVAAAPIEIYLLALEFMVVVMAVE
jgi:hypothetical protein